MSCSMPGMPNFLLTSIYALPHSDFRKILWDKLKALSAGISVPWVVWGDFNDIIAPNERIGGSGMNSRRIRWFQDQADESGLIDLGASGPRFTWKGPKIRGGLRIFERLDRAFANQEWITLLPNCGVKNLPRTRFSDHSPLLLNMGSTGRSYRQRPFRFEAMWMAHDGFKDFLNSLWNGRGEFECNIDKLRDALPGWNREVFAMKVELFKHPHLLLLRERNSIFKLPGGRLRPGESSKGSSCQTFK
ncbi:hypothetical protein K1719_006374 [Acacia pycnantha]|nr:hypothetical protein K1719_006374 [Acacia pycnantha]